MPEPSSLINPIENIKKSQSLGISPGKTKLLQNKKTHFQSDDDSDDDHINKNNNLILNSNNSNRNIISDEKQKHFQDEKSLPPLIAKNSGYL